MVQGISLSERFLYTQLMQRFLLRSLCLLLFISCQKPIEKIDIIDDPSLNYGSLFIYQGDYSNLGSTKEISELVAGHDVAVFTHGFTLSEEDWVNGHCLDVAYDSLANIIQQVRDLNPDIEIFGYVTATADHPLGCWPQPSVQLETCEDGICTDFIFWTNKWLSMEYANPEVQIDGIFVDLVNEVLISPLVRDNCFSYVKLANKRLFVNALSDSAGVAFALESTHLDSNDMLLVEGYQRIAGYENLQTSTIERLISASSVRWSAIVSETYGADIDCSNETFRNAIGRFDSLGGTSITYQAADLGTITGIWSSCLAQ
jgi:hypothetical protein